MSPGATLYFCYFAWTVTSLLDGPTVPLGFDYPREGVVEASDQKLGASDLTRPTFRFESYSQVTVEKQKPLPCSQQESS